MPLGLIAAYTLTVICGVTLAIQDIRRGKVALRVLASFLASCTLVFCNTHECSLAPFAVFVTVGGLYLLITKKSAFGSADYVVAFSVSFLMPHETWHLFVLSCGVLGSVSAIIFKSRKFPFIPSILGATLLASGGLWGLFGKALEP
ncbi:MAG: hypothetical protein LBF56_00460 [Holosporales bacterium]|nr:hypothetical protein [Holosporales bacterium]